jgi:hypothetical protein
LAVAVPVGAAKTVAGAPALLVGSIASDRKLSLGSPLATVLNCVHVAPESADL